MSPVFAARRRAEEFNSLVEGTPTRDLHDARTMELAELVGALRQAPPAAPRAEFVSGLRERLMAEAATTLTPVTHGAALAARAEERLTVTPRRTARERRIAAAVGGIAIVGATTSMAVAAQSALPGDTLYPLKRAMENAQTGFSVSDSQRGATLLDNASGRLHEVEALSRAGDGTERESVETIALTFAAFVEQASAASELLIADYEENGSADAIAELRDFTASSMEALAALESVLPDGARAALIQAAQVLTQIDAHAAALCSICGGEGISVIPPFAIRAVEDVVGGLSGALTRPLETAGGQELRQTGTGKTDGKGRKGAGSRGTGGTAGSGQQPSTVTGPPATGGTTSGPRGDQPTSEPSTLGEVIEGVLGGGSGGTGGNASTQPTTVPEVVEDVVEGVGGVVDGVVGGVVPEDSP